MVTYYYEAVKELLFGDFVDNLNGIMSIKEYISISFYLNEITPCLEAQNYAFFYVLPKKNSKKWLCNHKKRATIMLLVFCKKILNWNLFHNGYPAEFVCFFTILNAT